MAEDAGAPVNGGDEGPEATGADGLLPAEADAGWTEYSDSGGGEAEEAQGPPAVEVWNDYDPSMRFVAVFPVGEDQGAEASSVAYYIIEPGRHTGLHSDNAEEVVYVADGTGEAFVTGRQLLFNPGEFVVLAAGVEHDIYASGAVPLRLLSFFPTPEIVSTFQQTIYPPGGNVLSSRPPRPVIVELDPNDLPPDFPFDLSELGLAPADEPGEPQPEGEGAGR